MDERAGAASNEVIVDSLTLNDLEATDLVQQLERIRQAHGGAPLRVGVGVWTEGQGELLALRPEDPARNRRAGDLQRPDRERLPSPALQRPVPAREDPRVRCFESLAEFIDWLRPGPSSTSPSSPLASSLVFGGPEFVPPSSPGTGNRRHRCRPGGARTACSRNHRPRGLRGDVRLCHFRGALRLSPPWRARAQPSGTGVTPPRRELSGPRPSALAPLTPPPPRLLPRADGGRRRRRPARRGARRSGATPTAGEGAGS